MPRVNPASDMPPYHHLPLTRPGHGQGPVPAHGMVQREIRDPYGQAMHLPPSGHAPGAFPYDMLPALPPPEVLEQKLAAQLGEMRKVAVENDRLTLSHASLRKELAAAQQELQRLQAQGDAAKAVEEQEMRGLLERVARMEDDLKACETVKAELQQAHAEAQNLVMVRQRMEADAQMLSKDLQRSLSESQQLPALMAERDAARQEYQHLRSAYDYEMKLRVDHSESLQAMKINYDSMVTELEKLRAELRNSTNFTKSGIMYNVNIPQKDAGTSSHLSVGQIAYDSRYGGAQARTAPTGLGDRLSGSPSRGNTYDTSRVAGISSSKAGAHDGSRAGTGYDSLKGAGYDSSKVIATGGQAAATASHGSGADYYGSFAWGQSTSTYGSVQVPPSGPVSLSYDAAAMRKYSSAQALPSYGQAQAPSAYGHSQLSSTYGLAQAPSPFAAAQGSSPYGLAAQPPAYGSGRAAASARNNNEAPRARK